MKIRITTLFLICILMISVSCNLRNRPDKVILNPDITDVDNKGFTVNYYDNKGSMRVNLAGIEVPEYKPAERKVEYCGKEAFEHLNFFIEWLKKPDMRIKLYIVKRVGDREIDAYVVIEKMYDTTRHSLQGELLMMGYAKLKKDELPESKTKQNLIRLEEKTKAYKKRIWGTEGCEPLEDILSDTD